MGTNSALPAAAVTRQAKPHQGISRIQGIRDGPGTRDQDQAVVAGIRRHEQVVGREFELMRLVELANWRAKSGPGESS